MDVLDDAGLTPTLDDRTCDHCGPAARARLTVSVNGTELAYCRSCGNRYFDSLIKVGIVIVDLRHTT